MIHLDKKRILNLWNRLQGVPIEWDLRPYQKILAEINAYDLGKASNDELKEMSSRLIGRAQQGISPDNLLRSLRGSEKRSIS